MDISSSVKEELRLWEIWTDRQTDGRTWWSLYTPKNLCLWVCKNISNITWDQHANQQILAL